MTLSPQYRSVRRRGSVLWVRRHTRDFLGACHLDRARACTTIRPSAHDVQKPRSVRRGSSRAIRRPLHEMQRAHPRRRLRARRDVSGTDTARCAISLTALRTPRPGRSPPAWRRQATQPTPQGGPHATCLARPRSARRDCLCGDARSPAGGTASIRCRERTRRIRDCCKGKRRSR